MDIKRTILIAALAIVTYLMVLQWNQDYGGAALPPVASAQSAANPALASDLPSAAQNTRAAATGDLPTIEPSASEASALITAKSASSGLIQVQTDVFNLAIDPRGGDIVQLTLPKYPRRQDRPDVPFQLFDNGNERTYLAQSGLLGVNAPDQASGRALWHSAQSHYQMVGGQALNVDLTYQDNGIHFTKRFSFVPGRYEIKVSYLIDNQSAQPFSGNLFAQLKRDGSADPSSAGLASTATYLGAALWTPADPYKKLSLSDMDKHAFKESLQGGWVAWLQHYFVTAWIADKNSQNVLQTRKDPEGRYIVGFTGPAVVAAPGQQVETSATLYAGPKIQKRLKELSPGLELTVDYGFLWLLAQPIFWLLEHIHSLLGNWGWSIIVLTLLIKLAFFPLSAASYKSMARMRAVAPKLQSLKERFGDDRAKMSAAMMELYKKERINPLGGCLPILVQMPVFLALYWVLLESVEMRQAPWLGWITDLSIRDPYFILPIIMGATMLIQQRLNPTPPDPMQARIMQLMPIIFTFFFLWFASGLVLYWVVNNILSIAQQWYITRKMERALSLAKT